MHTIANLNKITKTINAVTYGEKQNPKMLILGGWGTTAEVYAKFAKYYSEKYYILIIEYPGFGKSPEPFEPLSVSDFAEITRLYCENVNFSPDVIFAHSMGCRLCAKLLGTEKTEFNPKKLIITGGAGLKHAPEKSLKQSIYKFAKNVLPEKAIENYKKSHGSDDYRNATPIMRDCLVKMVNEDLSDYFPKINVETLLIWGSLDDAAPLTDGQKIEKLMPNAGLAIMQNCTHFAFLDNPTLFYKICDAFLK